MATTKNTSSSGSIQSRKDYKNTPAGQYRYWDTEMKASEKRLRKWVNSADNITNVYIDDRVGNNPNAFRRGGHEGAFRLNLYHSNVKTIMNMLYGHLPRIDVSRVDNTGNDDQARVAAEIIERILRLDLDENGEELNTTLKAVLQDRMLAGLGCARVRYEVETEDEKVIDESAPVDYYYWGDVKWGWARTFSDLPWIAFRAYLTKDEVQKRFGDWAAANVVLKQEAVATGEDTANDPDMNSAWQKAEIWEIWDKATGKVVWYSEGCTRILDSKPDPLKLKGFFPCPPFFLANPTTKLYKPTPDFMLAQDLYNEIDVLQTRIAIITEAVKVVGVYDASADGVKRMLKEGTENDLIPVDNWALFAEKGGLKGQVDWMPIIDIVNALDKLVVLRDQTIGLLQQITGMADVMRGELQNQYEGVGQTEIKKEFASVRVQALQEEFAQFVSDLMQLRTEVISKHFSPETIVRLSNMQMSPDAKEVPAAIELIKQPKSLVTRVTIKPETMAQQDYAKLQQERSNYLNGLSTFIQAATPLIQQDPRSVPFLLEMLKWAMAGFKGGSEIEGVLDQAIEVMSQPEQQKEPEKSPEEIRGQQQIELEQVRSQAKQQAEDQKMQNEKQIREQDMQADIQTRAEEHRMELEKIEREMERDLILIAAKMEADTETELLTSQINAEQADRAVDSQIRADIMKTKLKITEVGAAKRADAGLKIIDKRMDADEKQKDRDAQPKPTKEE